MEPVKELSDAMRDGYNFSAGIKGKYRHFIGKTRTLKILQSDGSVTVERVEPAVRLDKDAR